jgi:hypothetical protein
MKNKLLWAAVATMSLAACSNDDVVNVNTNATDNDAIGFRTSVANTRASEVNYDNLNSFYVTALKSSNNEYEWGNTKPTRKFYKTTVNGVTTFDVPSKDVDPDNDDPVTWPTYDLDFFATNLDPATYTLNRPTSLTAQPYFQNFAPATKVADQIDFIYATNKGQRADFGNSVPLDFKHALAQIEIKAKCASSSYSVKVKGYKLVYLCGQGTFTYADPLSVGGVQADVVYADAQNAGTWSSVATIGGNASSYESGIWGGNGYDDAAYTGVSDPTQSNYILLEDEAKTIAGSSTEGTAMIIPQAISARNVGTHAAGFYIALLVQVDYLSGAPIYPPISNASSSTTDPERIAYRGLPKYYGYVIAPVSINFEAGKKYTFVLDLTNGVGYVDPEKPSTVDPDTYVPGDDNGTDPLPEDQKGNDDDDTAIEDAAVIGHPIKYSVTVSAWEDANVNWTNVTM